MGGEPRNAALPLTTPGSCAHLLVHTVPLQQEIKPASHDNSATGVENIVTTS